MLDQSSFPAAVLPAMLDALDQPVLGLQSTPDGVKLCFANPASIALTGAPKLPGPDGEALRDALKPDLAHGLELSLRDAEKNGAVTTYDHAIHDGEHTRRWRIVLTPMQLHPQLPIILAVGTEIETAGLIRDQDKEIARLKGRNRDLMAFAGLVAHDMRGPLATVKMATQLTLHGFQDLGDGKQQTIEMCQRVAEKCLTAIDDVMAQVSGLDVTDRSEIEFDARLACREIAEIVNPEGRLTITTPSGCISTDKAVFKSAVRNLLDNAVRFTKTRIDIQVDQADVDTHIVLTVADDGPGLPAGFDLKTHIDPNRATDRSKGGYGLSAVAQLLDSQGGEIDCDSSPAGSTFRVTMPGSILTRN